METKDYKLQKLMPVHGAELNGDGGNWHIVVLHADSLYVKIWSMDRLSGGLPTL
ncbi:MAG: hypothetical protein HFI76_13350 [Lachnospiraceae bacterium]|jgi:hypothetical protein|nr:hypothetical protein [Lachnospiraceae bacterium]